MSLLTEFINDFNDFLTQLRRVGLEAERLYYGPYRARVVDNKDPAKQGRIRVECKRAKLPPENRSWVLPMMHGASEGCGVFWPPQEDDLVWLFFDNGNPLDPLGYIGGWYGPGELDEEFESDENNEPQKRGFMTPGGHRVVLDDTSGEEKVTIRHKDGHIVQWTESGKVKVGKEDGSFEPMLKGSTVKTWLDGHIHPHAWGPTSPPSTPLPSGALSDDTETS